MGTDRRRRLTPDERRSQLLATGVAFLTERPLDELTIEALSERAGVSRGLVFHYFGSKQGLHQAVVGAAGHSMLSSSVPRPELPPIARLEDTLLRIVEFVREHRGSFFSLVRGVASGDPVVRSVADAVRDELAARLREAFVELGTADTPLLRVTLRSWVAFAEEVLIELALESDMPADRIVRFLSASVAGVIEAAAVLD